MANKVYINLPVKDLGKAKIFFEGLGFTLNPQFSDENACCMTISDTVSAMLLTVPFFKTFTRKDVCDAHRSTEVLIALDAASKQEVDDIVSKAIALGGATYGDPIDHGWMYQHSFADLDGHQWEFVYLDESQLPSW